MPHAIVTKDAERVFIHIEACRRLLWSKVNAHNQSLSLQYLEYLGSFKKSELESPSSNHNRPHNPIRTQTTEFLTHLLAQQNTFKRRRCVGSRFHLP